MKRFIENWGTAIGFAFLITIMIMMLSITRTQAQNRSWIRWMQGNGIPTFTPSNTDPASIAYGWEDSQTGKHYIFNKTTKLWEETIAFKGQKGDKGDKGDIGPQGPPGKDGTGAGTKSYTDPDDFGATRIDQTLRQAGRTQSYIDQNYPGLGITLDTRTDAAAWRKAFDVAGKTGKMLIPYGTFFFGPDSAPMPTFFRVIRITGYAYIEVTGTNGAPVITRPRPIDNGHANVMIQAHVRIDGLQIGCRTGQQANRIGIDIGPTYNSSYDGVDCFSLQEAIHLRFALNTTITMCEAQYCVKGWTADMGNWPGASNSNSQSNNTTFEHCRFNADVNSDVAFGIYAASGVTMRSNITEGFKVRVGIDWDSKGSAVVKGVQLYNNHQECVQGCTEAFIKLRMQGGIAVVDFSFGQYPAIMVDATAINGTYAFVEVSHMLYWVPVNGKYFKSAGCNWALNYNDNLLYNAQDAPNKFADPGAPYKVPGYCAAPVGQCGSDKVSATLIPR